jgi:mRNA interferase RelE/StbE
VKVNKAVEKICSNPFRGAHIKKLVGKLGGKYRYDIGDLRIVYSVDENKKIIFIEAIGPRGDVYL